MLFWSTSLAAEAALPSNGWFGGRGVALVVKGGDHSEHDVVLGRVICW